MIAAALVVLVACALFAACADLRRQTRRLRRMAVDAELRHQESRREISERLRRLEAEVAETREACDD